MPFHGSSDTYSMQQIAVWTVRGKSHLKTASGGVPDIRRDWGRGKFEFKLLVLLLFPWFHTGPLWHIARIRTQFIQCFVLRACLDRNFDGWRGDPSLFKVQHWTNPSCSLLVASSRALLAIAQHCVCACVCVCVKTSTFNTIMLRLEQTWANKEISILEITNKIIQNPCFPARNAKGIQQLWLFSKCVKLFEHSSLNGVLNWPRHSIRVLALCSDSTSPSPEKGIQTR